MFSNRERLSCFIVINATFQQILTELTRVKDTEKGMGWGCVQKYIYLCPVLHWQNDILLLQIVYMYKISINIRIWHGEDDVIKVHMWVPKWFLYFIWYYLISHDGWEFYCTYSHFVFICMLVCWYECFHKWWITWIRFWKFSFFAFFTFSPSIWILHLYDFRFHFFQQ